MTAPTRSTVTLSGASTDQAIPSGCTFFTFVSSSISLTTSTAVPGAELRSGGANSPVSGFNEINGPAVGTISANTQFAAVAGTSSTAYLAGTVYSPRDASKKSLARDCWAVKTTTLWQIRNTVADTAQDDDTVRFSVSAGTFSGTVHIEWFYG